MIQMVDSGKARAPSQVVVNALFQSFPGIANVAFVCMLFYLIFGILGLSLLMGSYDYCYDREEGGKLDEDWLWDLQLYPGQTTSSDWPLSQVNRTFCDSFNGALNNSLQYPDPSKVRALCSWHGRTEACLRGLMCVVRPPFLVLDFAMKPRL